MIEAVIKYN
jgi:hypothetical protein